LHFRDAFNLQPRDAAQMSRGASAVLAAFCAARGLVCRSADRGDAEAASEIPDCADAMMAGLWQGSPPKDRHHREEHRPSREDARQAGAEARLRGARGASLPTVAGLADVPPGSRIRYNPENAPTILGLDTTPRSAPCQARSDLTASRAAGVRQTGLEPAIEAAPARFDWIVIPVRRTPASSLECSF
jgi:hypothetical protein